MSPTPDSDRIAHCCSLISYPHKHVSICECRHANWAHGPVQGSLWSKELQQQRQGRNGFWLKTPNIKVCGHQRHESQNLESAVALTSRSVFCRGCFRLEAIQTQLGKHRETTGEVCHATCGTMRQQDIRLRRLRGVSCWPASDLRGVLRTCC